MVHTHPTLCQYRTRRISASEDRARDLAYAAGDPRSHALKPPPCALAQYRTPHSIAYLSIERRMAYASSVPDVT
eukprot:3941639-Rhodomonas_salina.3